jgi:predicted transcriptional regulator
MLPLAARYRILIPCERWTPVRREIIDSVFGRLREKRAALAYMVLYDHAWHNENRVNATIPEMSRWMGMDERTVTKSIEELEEKNLIVRALRGIAHSQINIPCWRVPLAEFNLNQQVWTPVPRFVITRYCRAFPNAILLVVLLHYQHVGWQNKCWPGIPTLCRRTGWSEIRVRRALRVMGHEGIWRNEGTNLPWPMEISYSPDRRHRRYRVRAVLYTRRRSGFSVVKVSREFRIQFKMEQKLGYESD